jgi:hypothetical protein
MWEYKVMVLQGAQVYRGFGGPSMYVGSLDDMGADGWELVTVTSQGPDTIGYFKREITEEENDVSE